MQGSPLQLTGCRWLHIVVLQLLMGLGWPSSAGKWVTRGPPPTYYLAAFANSSFRSPAADLGFLHNASVVFLADSVTRYQFIYLAHFLHRRQWDDAPGHRLCCEHHYQSFDGMYLAYLPLFGCSHICDCADHYDTETSIVKKGKKYVKVQQRVPRQPRNEHHYFRHAALATRLSFHFWPGGAFGMSAYMRTPTAADFAQYCATFPATAHAHRVVPTPPRHVFPSVQTFIRDVLHVEGHTVLVLNYGIWRKGPTSALAMTEDWLDWLAEVAHAAAPVVVWKTTTATRKWTWNPIDDPALLAGLRRRGFHIFDAYALTQGLLGVKPAMWDDFHFAAFVYRELNIAFLEFLRGLLAGPHQAGVLGDPGGGPRPPA